VRTAEFEAKVAEALVASDFVFRVRTKPYTEDVLVVTTEDGDEFEVRMVKDEAS
jgi:hypothetical protein